jgi:hypothetical protein
VFFEEYFTSITCPAVRGGLGRDFVHGADRFTAGRHRLWRFASCPPFLHHHLISVTDLLFLHSHPVKEQPSRQRAAFPSKSKRFGAEENSRESLRPRE